VLALSLVNLAFTSSVLQGGVIDKWALLNEKKFDVKQGKLITVYQCKRCLKTKIKAM
jgi:hypothetical protein